MDLVYALVIVDLRELPVDNRYHALSAQISVQRRVANANTPFRDSVGLGLCEAIEVSERQKGGDKGTAYHSSPASCISFR